MSSSYISDILKTSSLNVVSNEVPFSEGMIRVQHLSSCLIIRTALENMVMPYARPSYVRPAQLSKTKLALKTIELLSKESTGALPSGSVDEDIEYMLLMGHALGNFSDLSLISLTHQQKAASVIGRWGLVMGESEDNMTTALSLSQVCSCFPTQMVEISFCAPNPFEDPMMDTIPHALKTPYAAHLISPNTRLGCLYMNVIALVQYNNHCAISRLVNRADFTAIYTSLVDYSRKCPMTEKDRVEFMDKFNLLDERSIEACLNITLAYDIGYFGTFSIYEEELKIKVAKVRPKRLGSLFQTLGYLPAAMHSTSWIDEAIHMQRQIPENSATPRAEDYLRNYDSNAPRLIKTCHHYHHLLCGDYPERHTYTMSEPNTSYMFGSTHKLSPEGEIVEYNLANTSDQV